MDGRETGILNLRRGPWNTFQGIFLPAVSRFGLVVLGSLTCNPRPGKRLAPKWSQQSYAQEEGRSWRRAGTQAQGAMDKDKWGVTRRLLDRAALIGGPRFVQKGPKPD